MRTNRLVTTLSALCLTLVSSVAAAAEPDLPALQELGKRVFFDPISDPGEQSCSSCHAPSAGFVSADSTLNAWGVVVPGAAPGAAGNRKPPAVAYNVFSPAFGDRPDRICLGQDSARGCEGGLFYDGRATGDMVGDEVFKGDLALLSAYGEFTGPAADQALGPFANDVEMNVPDGRDGGVPGAEFVCNHVRRSAYAYLYENAWGEPINCREPEVAISFKRIAVAIAAWEMSSEVNSFSSRWDTALAADDDDTPNAFPLQDFSVLENLGHDLFFGLISERNPEGKDARCASCHSNDESELPGNSPDELFTDHRYHNIGVPANYEMTNADPDKPDMGLSNHVDPENVGQSGYDGNFRTPTLRNINKRPADGSIKAYMHNGYFKSLEDVVHFYNTATLKFDEERCPAGTSAAEARARDCWPAAEGNVGRSGRVGDLGLTEHEEAALVAYLKTMTDEETVKVPKAIVRATPKPPVATSRPRGFGLLGVLLWIFRFLF